MKDQIDLIHREGIANRERESNQVALSTYRFNPGGYIRAELGWEPWSGTDEHPGQQQILDAYTLALRQQVERRALERGELELDDLRHWQPGQVIQNWIRLEAGHTVGKTKLAAGIVNHFFDCFVPSIIYSFAPTWEQMHDLLWKEIKADRRDKELPGRILDTELKVDDDHFAKGRVASDADGRGTERVQGQHGEHLMFVLDEAEGIADFVFEGMESMTSGGIVIVLMLANPRTRTSQFHKAAQQVDVRSFRMSCLHHPNVVEDREIVPNAVRRDYVNRMLDRHCDIVSEHDEDAQTFEVPWRPGVIFKPAAEFLWRIMGIAPKDIADNTFVPVGRFEAAVAREAPSDHPEAARLGVDVARYGRDVGTLYVRHNGRVWRQARFAQRDTTAYAREIIATTEALIQQGVSSLHIRIDGGGGFGGGVIDQLTASVEFARLIEEHIADFELLEVHFGGAPYDWQAYADLATEMYATSADGLRFLSIGEHGESLEADLCERQYRWMTFRGVGVKRLEPKEKFRKDHKRSPDDGDGFVLAAAPDYIFTDPTGQLVVEDDWVEIGPAL